MSGDFNPDEIRSRIKRRYDNHAEFWSHLAGFVGANIVIWGFLHPQEDWATAAMVVMGLWFVGIIVHAIQYISKEAQERAIERAVEREREWHEFHELNIKRKRDHLRLTEDGELEEVIPDEEAQFTNRR